MPTAADGVIRRVGEGYEIVFVRHLAKPIEKVWAALTVPGRIADWLAAASIARIGKRFTLAVTGPRSPPSDVRAFAAARPLG